MGPQGYADAVDGRLLPVASQPSAEGLSWTEPVLADGEVYLVLADPAVATQLEQRHRQTPPFATEAGKSRPEGEGPAKDAQTDRNRLRR